MTAEMASIGLTSDRPSNSLATFKGPACCLPMLPTGILTARQHGTVPHGKDNGALVFPGRRSHAEPGRARIGSAHLRALRCVSVCLYVSHRECAVWKIELLFRAWTTFSRQIGIWFRILLLSGVPVRLYC